MKFNVLSCYKFIIVCCFLATSYTASMAQENHLLTFRGKIVDSLDQKPLSYSTVELYERASGQLIQKSYTSDPGEFKISAGEQGKSYYLLVRTIGYRQKKILTDPAAGPNFDLSVIALHKELTNLKEVTVQGTKPLIENKIDRLIFNPDLPTIQNSVTVSDVLLKAPLLSMGSNGQLLIRGKPNVKIYLNGRPASQDVVKGLPAGTISSIEIITNPTARYDAEGAAIVNIITKRSKVDGYEGTAMISGGIYDRVNALGSIAIKKSKLNVSLNYTLNNLTNTGVTENMTARASGLQEQLGTIRNKQLFQAGTIAADYEIDTLNKIGASVNLYQYNFHKRFNNHYTDTNPLDSTGNFDLQSYDNIRRYGGYGDLSFSHTFGKSKKTLNIAILHNELHIKDNLTQELNSAGMAAAGPLTNLNNEVFKETTYQLSFVNPLKNKSKFEVGTKYIVRDNNSQFSNAIDSISQTVLSDFEYKQHIFAVYGLYNFSLKKFNFQAGIRNETTDFNYFSTADGSGRKDNYNNLFPNLNILYSLKNDQQIKASYSERIQRPGIFYLNPYLNVLDPQNISSGSPQLKPEISHQLELEYSRSVGKNYLDFSFDYNKTSNSISSFVSDFSDRSLITSYTNAGNSDSYSGAVFYSTSPFKNNNLSLNFTGEYFKIKNELAANHGWNYYASFRDSYSWKNNFSANLTINYFSRQITLQGKSPGSFSNTLGISKSFLNKKLLFSILTDDPFRIGGVFDTKVAGQGFIQNMHNDINLRTIQARVVYYFGKRSSTKQHEKKVQNSDLKNGGL